MPQYRSIVKTCPRYVRAYNTTMKRTLLAAVIIGVLSVAFVSIPGSEAAVPSYPADIYGRTLQDGDLISAYQSDGDPDIFIIRNLFFTGSANPGDPEEQYNGFKRLFLNPAIFNMYGHLGGFSRVRQVTAGVRDSFVTSGLFRNCESGDRRVWATEVTGEDAGVLHHVEMAGERALQEDPWFFDKVFCINNREDAFYARSITPYYRIADIPRYFRRACQIRPACLDTYPRCLLPEPIEGWCPLPTPPTSCLEEGVSYTRANSGLPRTSYISCCPGLTPVSNRSSDGIPESYCVRPGCFYQEVQCIRAPCDPVLTCPYPNCNLLPDCALPGANPVCDITSFGPDGRPWCPYVVTG